MFAGTPEAVQMHSNRGWSACQELPMHDRLATLYPQHLATVRTHADRALAQGGFDHLLVAAGMPGVKFLDDNHYPYAVSPQFKYWLPLINAPGSWIAYTPGSKPKLVFLQPHDYWHVVPDAPSGYWVDQFDIVIVRTAEDAVAEVPKGNCATIAEPNPPSPASRSTTPARYWTTCTTTVPTRHPTNWN
jgi:Xaa-Pro dipeptidase